LKHQFDRSKQLSALSDNQSFDVLESRRSKIDLNHASAFLWPSPFVACARPLEIKAVPTSASLFLFIHFSHQNSRVVNTTCISSLFLTPKPSKLHFPYQRHHDWT
jgi:hypothetical protein